MEPWHSPAQRRPAPTERPGFGRGIAVLGAGCTGPGSEVQRRPTGEVDVQFRTEADRDYQLRVELRDGDGDIVDAFDSGLPPDRTPGPSFYVGGLPNGSYSMTIETERDRATVEWSVAECPRLDLVVTGLADGNLRVERTCSEATTEPGARTSRRTAR